MNELALFAGAGGGLLASRLLGWRTRCAVELDSYARRVLLARQRDGCLDRFPIWDDVKTFDGRPWRGSVDVVSGGFPCQDVSAAGTGRGLSGERSGLVFEMLRIVDEVQPRFVFAENSPLLRTRGLGTIVEQLDRMGYRSAWCVLGAWHVGSPHRRDRIWLLATNADRQSLRDESRGSSGTNREGPRIAANDGAQGVVANSERSRLEGQRTDAGQQQEPESRNGRPQSADSDRWRREGFWKTLTHEQGKRGDLFNRCGQRWPDDPADGEAQSFVGRVISNGMAAGLDRNKRLRAIGNGQVPRVAALAWNILRGLI